jgi:hypothetical protein
MRVARICRAGRMRLEKPCLLTVALALAAMLAGVHRDAAAAPAEPTSGAAGTSSPAAAAPKAKTKKRGKRRRAGKVAAPAAAPQQIADAPKITPFGHEEEAVARAMAEHHRDQILDAERAARAPKEDDRWHSVLFQIRDLDSRNNPEACFWRSVAYYRLGELARARKTRQLCDLPARDIAALDREDTTSAALQPPSTLPELRMAGDDGQGQPHGGDVKPVVNEEAYAGPAPTPPK